MTQHISGNNQLIEAIIKGYFQVPHTPTEKLDELSESLVKLIFQAFPNELRSANNAFNLPYKDIVDVVFYTQARLYSDSIYNFRQNVENAIYREYDISLSDKHHKTKEKYVKRFMHCHDKLVEHVLLAQAQRDFIKSSVENTEKLAQEVQATVKNAEDAAMMAKKTAEKAENVAIDAKNTAKTAENTYDSMYANYITILGIFAAIIISIFGGLNVIQSVVTSSLDNALPSIVFFTSLLMICEITILYFLAKIIKGLTDKELKLNFVFIIIIIVSLASMLWSYTIINN